MSALDTLYALVLDAGRRWGEAAVGWQRDAAAAMLEPGPDDPRLHWEGRPKGGSKTTDLAGMSCAWLIDQAEAGVDGYAVAADRDQAVRLLDRASGFIRRSPELGEVLEVQSRRVVNRRTGARVNALEADVASSEGILSPWLVVDELPNWASTVTARGMWQSVISTVPKWPGCRLMVIGHAGDPAHWSKRILDTAVKHPEQWRVAEVPGPLPWISEADLEMQRAMLLPSEFARRHLNVWTTAEDRLTTAEDLGACVVLDGPQAPEAGRWYVLSLDVGLKNDRTVAAVMSVPAWLEGRTHTVRLDRIGVWEGSPADPVDLNEVEAWVWQAAVQYGAPIVVDPYQAAQLTARLRSRGWRVLEYAFTQASVGRLARRLFQQIADHALELPDDEDLVDELANVRLRETSPGMWRMDHDAGRHDDRAIALALGCWGLLDSDLLRFSVDDGGWDDELEMEWADDIRISEF